MDSILVSQKELDEKKMRSMKVVYRLYRIQINDIYNQKKVILQSSKLGLYVS